MARQKLIHTKEVIDGSTGEVTVQEKTFLKRSDEPSYIKLYCNDIAALKGISPMNSKVLFAIAMSTDYNNEVRAALADRQRIADSLNAEGEGKTTAESVRVSIHQLCKAGFMTKKATGLYVLSPFFFTRTDWLGTVMKRKEFQMLIRYSEEQGRTISVSIDSANHLPE
jgi:hypothetical protein